ncbi:MAG TPA: 4-(cytidine 5'-diphospho)-2-C-methyl-D-erythritol kinase [Microthrixaceae bacterium]|nr:4-(cytidine 5'-diphospho)-2-C-methyl-D-erythritol kinase [Microthrixaceae bacterium]HMV75250.1 4-(cytidine 5'-diphospho)-2-C-methyl-D-erythritol kinase [Microthrixaceae bacterium]HMX06786.1 4-(cytidine 5'-diphospho)-2-C-methyl-D-erythritol kinase [Microthrixaceae bacterium]HMX64934.1 4-(cytidine 5'-diphospho)-2-C-methyl-D-erythritol kinase [Microthrixaceae bacterium]HMY86456.1 4-(cytidine 5'-diphospho)-2-C-methyl-D-erythritol kinase [Microthrixaceae bacterium]
MIEVVAPAKLTLSLRIRGVRSDGFHEIDAEMVSLDLGDVLEIDLEGDGLLVERDGRWEPGGSDDLVNRSLRLVDRRVGVRLRKVVPAGAGLGGGSADAAAILRWAGVRDPRRAVHLGADVAFCVVGGRARVRGIGEDIEPLPFEDRTFTLLTPPLHCSTPVVYRRWDDMGGPLGDHGNDLEPAALSAYPELARWRDELENLTGRRPRLAGSGSTWFVEGAYEGPSTVVARTVRGS